METKVLKIALDNLSQYEEELELAAACIREGGLVAFPTETVYGLGGDGLLKEASKKIYAAKGRPSDNPLIIHISDFDDVYKLASEVPDNAKKLMKAFWPGPVTLIFKKSDIVPYETTGGLDTVAIRFPIHPIARELIRRSGRYIAAPSANRSGRPSPTRAEHVVEDLSGNVDVIIDGGAVDIGLESTIIDMTAEVPTILRPGFVTDDMIREVLGNVVYDPAILAKGIDEHMVAKAPGMKYKHYAPKAPLTIIEGDSEEVLSSFDRMIKDDRSKGLKVGAIVTDNIVDKIDADSVISLGDRDDYKAISHNLFASLRQMDTDGVDVIYSVSFSDKALGMAIMNRLLKAAGYKVHHSS